MIYVYREENRGFGERVYYMRSRKRSRLKAKRHTHIVTWNPEERSLWCVCHGWQYRRICSGTRHVLRKLV